MNEKTVQSVERALQILEELARDKHGLGVTRLAAALDLHKSTVHRLLGTLMARGYVDKEPEGDRYRLGTRILFLAGAVLERMDVRTVARPYIRQLSLETNEVVHLAVRDGDEVVYIDKEESPRQNSVRLHSKIGRRAMLHCTAVGKVLLSDLSEQQVSEVIQRTSLPKFTDNTITDAASLEKELAKIRGQGYALDESEHERDIRCVAAPIRDRDGTVIAAISISGPVIHVTGERLPILARAVQDTALKISWELGY
ncbi:MAG: IclR family transcriptional regulator [Firmicutes bacterium]|nr:IclR family transcriptional regulator [Bacillota bacterium]